MPPTRRGRDRELNRNERRRRQSVTGELPAPTLDELATGPNVPPPPGTPAPATPAAQSRRGSLLSRVLRGAARRVRGNNQ